MKQNIQNTKIDLIQWLTTLEDLSVLKKIVDIKEKDDKDWWDEISLAEKKSIEKGIKDAKLGKVQPHSKARKVYEKWL